MNGQAEREDKWNVHRSIVNVWIYISDFQNRSCPTPYENGRNTQR